MIRVVRIPHNWTNGVKAVASRLAYVTLRWTLLNFSVYKRLKIGINWLKQRSRLMQVVLSRGCSQKQKNLTIVSILKSKSVHCSGFLEAVFFLDRRQCLFLHESWMFLCKYSHQPSEPISRRYPLRKRPKMHMPCF